MASARRLLSLASVILQANVQGTRSGLTRRRAKFAMPKLEVLEDRCMLSASYYVNDASTVGDVFCTTPGNNANDGKSPATPVASLAYLLSLYTFHAGDIIYVDTGAYEMLTNLKLGPQYSGVNIVGAGERQPMPSPIATVILADNPVAFWPLNDSGGSTAADATGNGNDGTYMNGLVQGIPGPSINGASEFDDQSEVSVPDAPALNPTQYSIEAWVNYHGISENQLGTIVDKSPSDWSTGYRLAVNYSGQLTFMGVTAPLPLSQWVYVVATYDGQTAQLYVNGALASSAEVGSVTPSNAPFMIGNGPGTIGGHTVSYVFHGAISDVAFYQYVLSAQQIATHYYSVSWSGTLLNRDNMATGSYAIELSGAANVTISNLSITQAAIGLYAGPGADSVGLTVSNVSIYENGQSIDLEASNDNVTITGSSVGSTTANYKVGGDGITIAAANSTLLGNSVFGSYGNGINIEGPTTTISNNLVFDNWDSGIFVNNASDALISENDAFGNGFQGTVQDEPGIFT